MHRSEIVKKNHYTQGFFFPRTLNEDTRSMPIRQIGWDKCLERANNLLAEKVSIFKSLDISHTSANIAKTAWFL